MVSATSCNDYLDTPPSKSSGVEISTAEELMALLSYNNYSEQIYDRNAASIVCGDCFDLSKEYYDGGLSTLSNSAENYQLACWDMKYTQNTNENVSMWTDNYRSIYLANLVLSNVDDVEGTKEEKDLVAQKAHMVRAYNFFDLAQYYCMPYGERTLNEPGLPIKRTTGYDEPYTRASLADTYDFIEQDILEAVKITEPLFSDGERKSWRETGATANSLAARFYLAKGDYQKALEYAEKALQFGDDIADFNDTSNLSQTISLSLGDFSMVFVPTWWSPTESSEKYTGTMDRSYYWKQNSYLLNNIWGIPSEKLLAAFNHQYDLRYRYFIISNFQKIYFLGLYALDFTTDVPGYGTFNMMYPTAPNVAEMMLTKAECLARLDRTSEAVAELNNFRRYRFASNTPSEILNVSAQSSREAIDLALKERMLEFPFTVRWNDIRRCNFNNDPADDVVIKRDFYKVGEYSVDTSSTATYVLDSNSRGYAVAIPNADIVSSNGEIQQNEY